MLMQRRPRNCSRWASKSPKKVWKTSKLHWRWNKMFFDASGASFECYSWLLHLERLLTLLLLLLLVEGAMAWKWKCALEGEKSCFYASGASFECVLIIVTAEYSCSSSFGGGNPRWQQRQQRQQRQGDRWKRGRQMEKAVCSIGQRGRQRWKRGRQMEATAVSADKQKWRKRGRQHQKHETPTKNDFRVICTLSVHVMSITCCVPDNLVLAIVTTESGTGGAGRSVGKSWWQCSTTRITAWTVTLIILAIVLKYLTLTWELSMIAKS